LRTTSCVRRAKKGLKGDLLETKIALAHVVLNWSRQDASS
jgi:hypothetical protein